MSSNLYISIKSYLFSFRCNLQGKISCFKLIADSYLPVPALLLAGGICCAFYNCHHHLLQINHQMHNALMRLIVMRCSSLARKRSSPFRSVAPFQPDPGLPLSSNFAKVYRIVQFKCTKLNNLTSRRICDYYWSYSCGHRKTHYPVANVLSNHPHSCMGHTA